MAWLVCVMRCATVPMSVMWGLSGWVIGRCAAVCPSRWWWFGGAPTEGLRAVGQRPLGRLPCTCPMASTSRRLRRSGLWSVGGFGREFS